jgi:homeobox protein cut-like
MEGGIDTEEQSSLEAAQDTRQVADAQEDGGDENKFQKAIGAWRSKKTGRINYTSGS